MFAFGPKCIKSIYFVYYKIKFKKPYNININSLEAKYNAQIQVNCHVLSKPVENVRNLWLHRSQALRENLHYYSTKETLY